MLTIDTTKKALELLALGHTFPSVEEKTGITREEASAVANAYDKDETAEQLFRELQLAGLLELVAAKLRSGDGWDESTTTRCAQRGLARLSVACEEGTRAGAAVGPLLRLPFLISESPSP
jgi:hypothetical protein